MNTVKDTPEHWFGADTVVLSAVGEAASHPNVRFSDVVDVEDVQYIN